MTECALGSLPEDAPLLLNCLGAMAQSVTLHLPSRRRRETAVLVAEAGQAESLRRFGTVLPLPASYGARGGGAHRRILLLAFRAGGCHTPTRWEGWRRLAEIERLAVPTTGGA